MRCACGEWNMCGDAPGACLQLNDKHLCMEHDGTQSHNIRKFRSIQAKQKEIASRETLAAGASFVKGSSGIRRPGTGITLNRSAKYDPAGKPGGAVFLWRKCSCIAIMLRIGMDRSMIFRIPIRHQTVSCKLPISSSIRMNRVWRNSASASV